MNAAPAKIASLRHLLAERFPSMARQAGRVLVSGIASLDAAQGGLPLGSVTELVATSASSGGHSVLAQLLASTRLNSQRVALVDAAHCFDPASLPADHLAHLVWVRTQTCVQAVQAADLLARDANLNLVCLDLRDVAAAELRRITGSQWYRLQRAAEPADLALLVLTPHPCVPSAELRFSLEHSHTLDDLEQERPMLVTQLEPTLERQRRSIATAG